MNLAFTGGVHDWTPSRMADIKRKDLPIEGYTFPASRSGHKLDLYNLESAYAEDSPYVLTSPRSLEACAQLNIKVSLTLWVDKFPLSHWSSLLIAALWDIRNLPWVAKSVMQWIELLSYLFIIWPILSKS